MQSTIVLVNTPKKSALQSVWLGDARCVAVAREKATLFVSPLDKKDAFHEALKTQIGNHPQINLFS